jgi:hypothetical protein
MIVGLVTMLASGAWADKDNNNGNGNGNGNANGNANANSQADHENNGKGKGRPPGNNGTVKLDGVPLGNGKGNEPHVGCVFNVEFYNFDEGDEADFMATVTFALQAPTLREGDKKPGEILLTDKVFIGEDAAGGGNDLDASKEYQLSFDGIEAHPKQGYHVKLTVNAPGSQGADKKHKVFWTKCDTPVTPPPPPPPPPPPVTPPVTPPAPTVTPTPTATPEVIAAAVAPAVTAAAPAPVVLGATETKPAPAALATTGAALDRLLFLGGLAMVLAALTLLGANTGRRRVQITS